jgi:hypothetical protein
MTILGLKARMYDAFISYSRGDLPAVLALKRQIEECRLRAFIDLESLRAGKEWPPQVGAALQASRVMILCWSAHAASSEWVRAEVNQSLLIGEGVRVLPWLLDSTRLPPMLQQTQGIAATDPTAVVKAIADERRRHEFRIAATLIIGIVFLATVCLLIPPLLFRPTLSFSGHVMDVDGSDLVGAIVEVEHARTHTNAHGDFAISLPDTSARRVLRVKVWKPGYQRKIVETQSDVPHLGVVLERDQ